MRKQYKIRHIILQELFDSAGKEKNPQIPKIRLSNIEIAKRTNIPIADIDIFHELLNEEKEVECCFDLKGTHDMVITSKGRQSYINKKFLKEGRKEFWDNIYDPLKIILPGISILIAALALYFTNTSTNKIDKLNDHVKILQTQVDSLRMNK